MYPLGNLGQRMSGDLAQVAQPLTGAVEAAVLLVDRKSQVQTVSLLHMSPWILRSAP